MDNIITIGEDTPEHLMTYWMGVLVGMGIPYKIDPKSPLYRTLKEYRKERHSSIRTSEKEFMCDGGVTVLTGAGKDDTTLTVKLL